jgi:formate dehydrogenase iron-sulfur subunit
MTTEDLSVNAEDPLRRANQARHTYVAEGRTVGFFTDPTVCIGCKACEVACKEWNNVPADGFVWSGQSYDNSHGLGAATWRHVKFLELDRRIGPAAEGAATDGARKPFGWLFLSDVCKHCENAGCLEACPTGAIFRTEVSSVYVQDDVCNGCGYCIVGCPFGVIDRRPQPLPGAGGAFKCTFCYDRQIDGLTPACAKACPTESIQFGPLDELHARAEKRVADLHARGVTDATIYNPTDTSVGGIHAFFLLLGPPEEFGLPPRPEVPTVYLKAAWLSAAMTSVLALAGAWLAFALM